MPKRKLIVSVCLFALAIAACGGSSEPANETTPAAAAGDPNTPATSGAETTTTTSVAAEPPAPEHAPAEPAANVAPEPQQMAKYGVIVVHKVKSYDTWKPVFDSDAQGRKESGFTGHMLMRGAADPNLVAIWLPSTDIEKAKAYVASKDLKDKMKQAGVQGKPEIMFASVAGAQMDPKKQGLSGALLTAKVKDFDAFKTAFESAAQARTDAGIVGYGLSQDVADKTVTYVYLQSEDAAKLKTYVDAKETKQAWKDAGVVGPAKVTLVQESEMTMYP
jgi:quinol monooxygenase YgiN